jgi:CRP/FNR family cyclic AMP-dependent transcriptional regulator
MDIATMQDRLAEHPFLAGLPAAWLEPMSLHARRSARHAGGRLFHEGGSAGRFWLLVDGRVAIDTTVPGRGEVVVGTLGPGAVVGWSWLFPPYTWHFGALVVAETQAIEFDAAGVLRLCERDPALGFELTRRFLGVALDRLQATRDRLVGLERR